MLYSGELRDLTAYHAVLLELARGVNSPVAIARASGIDARTLNYHLGVLCELGYVVRRYPVIGTKPAARAVRYVLQDSLLRFWFRFVFPHQSLIRSLGPQRAFAELVRPQLDAWFGACFERLCLECLPLLYARDAMHAAFECGQYWDARVQIDVVGVRQDGWTDLGECKWGPCSLTAAAAELEQKPALVRLGMRLPV